MFRSAPLVAAGSLLGLLLPLVPQEKQPTPQDKAAGATAQQDAHAAPAKTGVHRTFAQLAGDYDVATKLTLPDGTAMTSKGTAKMTAILDGRFLLEENEGELMGKKVKGVRIYGWNAEAKQFEALWLYTESNAMMRLTGKAGSDRRSIEFEAVVQEAPDKKGSFQIKAQRNRDNTLVVTMVHKGEDGEAAATLEETYTKKG